MRMSSVPDKVRVTIEKQKYAFVFGRQQKSKQETKKYLYKVDYECSSVKKNTKGLCP